jgi:hypothetical protein
VGAIHFDIHYANKQACNFFQTNIEGIKQVEEVLLGQSQFRML